MASTPPADAPATADPDSVAVTIGDDGSSSDKRIPESAAVSIPAVELASGTAANPFPKSEPHAAAPAAAAAAAAADEKAAPAAKKKGGDYSGAGSSAASHSHDEKAEKPAPKPAAAAAVAAAAAAGGKKTGDFSGAGSSDHHAAGGDDLVHGPGKPEVGPGGMQKKVEEVVTKVFGLKPIKSTRVGCCICCRVEIHDEVRMISWVVFAVFAMLATAFLIADLVLNKISIDEVYDNYSHGVSLLISFVFCISSVYVSWVLIRGHQNHFFHPSSQQQVIRILWMVPVYSICSFCSLMLIQFSLYIDFIRACYEAFVIYSFMILLTTYLGGHGGVTDVIMGLPEPHYPKWPAPLCCIPKFKPSPQFLWYLKYGALQYVYLVPFISVTAIVCSFFKIYGDGQFGWDHGYTYCAFMMNLSQLVALYVLAWLYICCKNELAPFRPMSKFLVVKAVVFMTFWQSVAISFMEKIGWITETENFTAGELNMSLQNFLVCIEMFIAAAAHKYTFGFETYKDGSMLVLMEVRKELRDAKRALDQAGFQNLEPGQTGEVVPVDEHGHAIRPAAPVLATGPGAPQPGAAGAAGPNGQWQPLPGTPEALAAIGQGFVEFGGMAKDVTVQGAKKVRDFTHQMLKAEDIF